MKGNWN